MCAERFDVDIVNAGSYVEVTDGSDDVTDDVMKGSDSAWQGDGDKVTLRVTPVGSSLEISGFSFMVSNIVNVIISAKVLVVTEPLVLVQYTLIMLCHFIHFTNNPISIHGTQVLFLCIGVL